MNMMVPKSRVEEVKNKVSIPDYFDKVIVPQMGSYYDLYPVDFDNKPVVCCPLHDEDTPSFRYYPDTHSFYCFGCQKGGNIINLHRYFTESITGTKPEYEESVTYLYDSFINGKVIQNDIVGISITQDKRSTEKELLEYNMYRTDIERSLMVDRTIPEELKFEICEKIDSIDILVIKDLVNAVEAKNWLKTYINSKVKEGVTS